MRLIAYWEETVPRTTATHNRTATKPRPLISILTLTVEQKIFKREKVKETMMKIKVLFQYESTKFYGKETDPIGLLWVTKPGLL